jgi:hypothetical protein
LILLCTTQRLNIEVPTQQLCAASKHYFTLVLLSSHCAHTDASLLQESLDLLLPGDEGILRWEAQQLRSRQEGLVELLATVRESMPEPLKDAVALVPGVAESLETTSSSLQSLQSSLEATEAGLSVETVLQEVAETATAAAAGTAGDVEGTKAAAAAALAAGADAAAAPDAAVLCDVLDGVQEAVQSSTSAGKARADNEITGWFSMLADSVNKHIYCHSNFCCVVLYASHLYAAVYLLLRLMRNLFSVLSSTELVTLCIEVVL